MYPFFLFFGPEFGDPGREIFGVELVRCLEDSQEPGSSLLECGDLRMEFLLSLDQVCVVFFDQALNGFGYPLDVPPKTVDNPRLWCSIYIVIDRFYIHKLNR